MRSLAKALGVCVWLHYFARENLRAIKEHGGNSLSRRQFLLASTLAGAGLMLPPFAAAQNSTHMPMASATATPPVKSGPAEVSLRIGPVLVDVTKDKTIMGTTRPEFSKTPFWSRDSAGLMWIL
jgi:hypothetical protein